MSRFGLKITKSESPDKTPYTSYYPHTIPSTSRNWVQPYYQFVSIDPAGKNFALRIERRYHNGWITPVVFDKVAVASIEQEGDTTICNTYQVLTGFLEKYKQYYADCHFIVIERQLPQNYKATRIAQHTISYFSITLHNKELLPSIVEIDPKIKGKTLGAPKGITDKQLKSWSVEEGRKLLTIRRDTFSLQVLDCFKNKQDDLCDTVCQLEALVICWGFPPTSIPPNITPDNTPLKEIKPITLKHIPNMLINIYDEEVPNNNNNNNLPNNNNNNNNLPLIIGSIKKEVPKVSVKENTVQLLALLQTAPTRPISQEQKPVVAPKLVLLPVKGKK